MHPIQETGKRPTAGLDRNLAYLGLVEVLYGYPLDGVVLTIGCDKTTPAMLMGAATVNIPAIALSVGPMLNGWHKGERTGSGTIVWKARQMMAAGEIDYAQFIELVASSAPSTGYCNTMGTATTMNSLAEALGMQLPGSAAIPAPYRDRQEMAYRTGKRIVDMVHEDLKPSDILTKDNFINTIVVNSAIGGSTNAPIHIQAIAKHIGVELELQDFQTYGHKVPLLVNLQPAGEYLGEDYLPCRRRAGGGQRADEAGADSRERPDRQWQVHRRELPHHHDPGRQGHPPLRQSAQDRSRFPGAARQSVRQRHHEDQRDLDRVPRSLSQQSRTSRHVRRQGRGLRRS